MRDQHELALRCLRVEQAGEDVYEYLKRQGFISPRATWQRLQLNELHRKQSDVDKGEVMKKVTDEQKNEAVRMAVKGEDPRKYLAQCGSTNPDKLWGYIKTRLKQNDPVLYEKLPDFRHSAKKKPAADKPPVVKITGPIRIETPEADRVEIVETPEKPGKITKPLQYMDFTVRGLEGEYGSYSFSDINGRQWIDYDDKEKANQLSMTIEQWRGFLKELIDAAKVLGVELL